MWFRLSVWTARTRGFELCEGAISCYNNTTVASERKGEREKETGNTNTASECTLGLAGSFRSSSKSSQPPVSLYAHGKFDFGWPVSSPRGFQRHRCVDLGICFRMSGGSIDLPQDCVAECDAADSVVRGRHLNRKTRPMFYQRGNDRDITG